MVFAVVTWVLFGLTIGGMVAFFMERWGHTYEHLLSGVGGAFFGGILGMFLGAYVPDFAWNVRGYSITSLILAIAFSTVFTLTERYMHRRGRILLSDPRPDVP